MNRAMNVVTSWLKANLSNRQVVLLVGFLLAAFLILYFFGSMIAPVLAAVVIAFLLDGPLESLVRRGVPYLGAVIIVFLGFLVLAFVAFFTILPPITNQVVQFVGQLPNMLALIEENAAKLVDRYPEMFDPAQVDTLMASIQGEIITGAQRLLEFSVSNITGLIAFVVYVILVPVMVFFFLKDRDRILAWVGGCLPEDRKLADQVWDEVVEKTGNYARGKVLEIFIVGLTAWVAFWAIDLQFAAFLAFITGISVLIPYIGAAVVTFPVAVVAYFQWGLSGEFALALGVYLILQALDGNVLVPVLFSEVVKLHPNAIILAILIFGGIWGFWGVFFAIPLATLAHAVIRAWPRQPVKAARKKTPT